MQRTHSRFTFGCALILTCGVLLSVGTNLAAQPTERYSLGAGIIRSTVSGGLDGVSFFTTPSGSPVVVAAEPEAGSGFVLFGGYRVNENFELEAQISGTSHDATHVSYPNENLSTTIVNFEVGGRLVGNLGDSFQVYGRFALASVSVHQDDVTTLPPSTQRLGADYSGVGFAYGGGIVFYFLDNIGLELGAGKQSVTLSTLDAAEVTGEIPDRDLDQTRVMATIRGRFGLN